MKYWMIGLLLASVLTLTVKGQQNKAVAEESQFKGEFIYLRDYGTDDIGYLVLPEEQPKAGVVLVPDGHGIDAWMKITADVIAKKGYIVLVLDLFNGNVITDDQQAKRMEDELMGNGVLAGLKTSTIFFQQSPRFMMDKVFIVSMGSISPHIVEFAAQKDVKINGIVIINPLQIPYANELKRVRYPIQFQVKANSPLAMDLEKTVQDIKYQDLIEVAPEAIKANNERSLKDSQWRGIEAFMKKNSTEERQKSLLSRIFE